MAFWFIFICRMSEMLFDGVCHMSVAVSLNHVCTQLRCNPNSHVIFWARRRKEDAKKNETWWWVGWENEQREASLPIGLFTPCESKCSFMCMHMWSRSYVWEEGVLPAVFFPEPLPVAQHTHTQNSQCRRQRVRPTQQRRRLSGASVSLPPPSSVCFHPLWMLP